LKLFLYSLNEKIGCNLKITDQILMQFYMVIYFTWFCKSNESVHSSSSSSSSSRRT